jgi:hypothetical protein
MKSKDSYLKATTNYVKNYNSLGYFYGEFSLKRMLTDGRQTDALGLVWSDVQCFCSDPMFGAIRC